jgi:lysophospholipase L1-like esterase
MAGPDFRKMPRIDFDPGKTVLHSGRVFRVNNVGMIGDDRTIEKPKGTIRILALRGSTSFGPWDDPWPVQLQRALDRLGKGSRFQVINGAFIGHNSFNLRDLFFKYRWLDLKPDLILIYSGFNDFSALQADIVSIQPYRPYRLRRILVQLSNFLANHSLAYASLREQAFRLIFSSIAKGYRALGRRDKDAELTAEELKEKLRWERGERKKVAEVFYNPEKFFGSRVYQEWRGHFKKNLGEILGKAKEKGIPTILMKQAFRRQSDKPEDDFWKRYYPDAIFTALDKLAAQFGTFTIDIHALFSTQPELRTLFEYDEIHLSPKGTAIIADRIIRAFKEFGLFQKMLLRSRTNRGGRLIGGETMLISG